MAAVSPPLTYPVPAVAPVLGISRGQAYLLAADGKLPGATRLGGRRWVVKAAALAAYLGVGLDDLHAAIEGAAA